MIRSTVNSPNENALELRISQLDNAQIYPAIPSGKPGTPCKILAGTSMIPALLHWSENDQLYWISTNSFQPFSHQISLANFLEQQGFKKGDTVELDLKPSFHFFILNTPIKPRLIDAFEQALLEKAGQDNGWERVLQKDNSQLTLASARHKAEVQIKPGQQPDSWHITLPSELLAQELRRSFPEQITGLIAEVQDDETLGQLLKRIAELSYSLPDQAIETYQEQVNIELIKVRENGTEVERLVKQRVGQDAFRKAMLQYWGGACSVTGLDIKELLRASHAKPWAACESDQERLDVFNGFLLAAHLDVLFDQGLISFSEEGNIILSSRLTVTHQKLLNLDPTLKLRWLAPKHQPYLNWHRHQVFIA